MNEVLVRFRQASPQGEQRPVVEHVRRQERRAA